jgi:hypothetical protein
VASSSVGALLQTSVGIPKLIAMRSAKNMPTSRRFCATCRIAGSRTEQPFERNAGEANVVMPVRREDGRMVTALLPVGNHCFGPRNPWVPQAPQANGLNVENC